MPNKKYIKIEIGDLIIHKIFDTDIISNVYMIISKRKDINYINDRVMNITQFYLKNPLNDEIIEFDINTIKNNIKTNKFKLIKKKKVLDN